MTDITKVDETKLSEVRTVYIMKDDLLERQQMLKNEQANIATELAEVEAKLKLFTAVEPKE